MIRLRTLLLAGLALFGAGHAEDGDGRYAVKGAGLMTCATFNEELSKTYEKAQAALAWIAGYLTAVNASNEGTFDIVSWQSDGMIAQALTARCSANPDEPLAQVTAAMVATMQTDKITAEERPVSIKVGRRERVLYPSVIVRMQEALVSEQNDVKASGSFDEATKDALRAFQREQSLAVTGFPDSITLFRLFQSAER